MLSTVSEIDRQRQILIDGVGGLVDEEIVAIGYFHREGTSDDSWRKGPNALRRMFAKRDDHPADSLGFRNVLVLTPTRVLVFSGNAKPPLVRVKDLVGAWPLSEVGLTSTNHTSQAYMSHGSGTYDTPVVRASLTFAGGEEPLGMDLPRDELAREVVSAIKAACGPQS
jgi:hypothetical protein